MNSHDTDVLAPHRPLLSGLLPHDAPDRLAVHEGQFHRVVVGAERVVCFARTEAAAGRLPERAAVLRVLDGVDLGFRTPRLLAEEASYVVMSRVPGAPLDAEALRDPAVAEAVARQYVELLRGLAAAGADGEVRGALRAAPEGEWQRFAVDVRTRLFPLMSAAGQERAARELAALDALPRLTSAVVHGDLGGENVLWETANGLPRLSGVIDWDEVGLGDPAEDLAAVGASHGDALLGRVLALGGWDDGATTARIAAIRGTFALQQAWYAERDGDAAELADGLAGYR
ncbi:viomycin phosphotransferase [Streptomyces sp. NPDC048057]|uniref:viomycin phosphotransferase n=1 Tax=Streptomyces sp. NPDC048057 TaxID=3155628 RepID=UPI0033C5D0F7